MQVISASDVHLVSLRPDLEGLIVPSKFYGIAAAGRAAIFIGTPDGEIAKVLARHDCGLAVNEGDGLALARAIRDLSRSSHRTAEMGANARRAFERYYDREIAVRRWQALIASVRGSAIGKAVI